MANELQIFLEHTKCFIAATHERCACPQSKARTPHSCYQLVVLSELRPEVSTRNLLPDSAHCLPAATRSSAAHTVVGPRTPAL